MDFIVGLPHTLVGYDPIWVIVDRLMKVACPLHSSKKTYLGAKLLELYMSRIIYMHGMPKKIVLDRCT
jgi:hypothetical protein